MGVLGLNLCAVRRRLRQSGAGERRTLNPGKEGFPFAVVGSVRVTKLLRRASSSSSVLWWLRLEVHNAENH